MVDTRHVFAYGISFRRQRFIERFSWFFFFLNGHVVSFERLAFAGNMARNIKIYI